MSSAQVQPPPCRNQGRRALGWAIVGVCGVAAFLVGLYFYLEYAHERELREAIAEADRLDPGWRFAEMEAARAAVPAAENSAAVVAAAAALVPKNWRAVLTAANGLPSLEERLANVPPQQRPDEADLNLLRAELAKAGPALAKARELADRPRGRYTVAWSEDLIGTLTPHLEHPRELVHLLTLDALLRCHDDDVEGSFRSCKAALNVGRSLGDEPLAISQNVRAHCAAEAARALQRTLAVGTVPAGELEAMQRLLADENAQPYLLTALRSTRLCYFQPLELMRTGRFNRGIYKLRASMIGETGDEWVDRRKAAASEAAYLRWCTALVEIAKLPTEAQDQQLRQLPSPTERLPMLIDALTRGGGNDWVKLARNFHRAHADLRCATAALAIERYRLAEGRWPDRLDALVPKYLAAVPVDPFDGRPLRLRRLADGLVIYSVGPDRTDDGGKLERAQPGDLGIDIGFQLWDR